jgi:hypothetical protein
MEATEAVVISKRGSTPSFINSSDTEGGRGGYQVLG